MHSAVIVIIRDWILFALGCMCFARDTRHPLIDLSVSSHIKCSSRMRMAATDSSFNEAASPVRSCKYQVFCVLDAWTKYK